MFLIVLFHVIHHGNVLWNVQIKVVSLLLEFILFLTVVHVNSFILVTGYYQCESKFKISKVISLFFTSLFYIVLIMLIFEILNIYDFSALDWYNELNFFENGGYWFIKYYIVLYILSPFYNVIINNLGKKKFKYMLMVIILLFGIFPWLTGSRFMYNTGFSIIQFSIMYFTGAYFRKYPLNLKENVLKKRLLFIFIIIFSTLLNFCSYKFLSRYIGINPVLDLINNSIIGMKLAYNNGFVMLSSVCYFLLFATFSFRNKFVDKISQFMFGVYLIHDNNFVRLVLYDKIFHLDYIYINSYKYIFYVFAVALLIFIACALIEFIRNFIINLIKKKFFIKEKLNKLDEWFSQFC